MNYVYAMHPMHCSSFPPVKATKMSMIQQENKSVSHVYAMQ